MSKSFFGLIFFGFALLAITGCASMSEVGEGMTVGGMANPSNPLSVAIAGTGMLINSIGKNLPQNSGDEVTDDSLAQQMKPGAKMNRSIIRIKFQRSLPKGDLSEQSIREQAEIFCKDFKNKEYEPLFYGNCVDDVSAAGDEVAAKRRKQTN